MVRAISRLFVRIAPGATRLHILLVLVSVCLLVLRMTLAGPSVLAQSLSGQGRNDTLNPQTSAVESQNSILQTNGRGAIGIGNDLFAEQSGNTVLWLVPGGPAARAGIQVGDIILHVNGRDLYAGFKQISEQSPGSRVTLEFRRGSQRMDAVAEVEDQLAMHLHAAQLGDAVSQAVTGEIYANGFGVQKSLNEALTWFSKSAEQGNARAQVNLGDLYAHGEGIRHDDVIAYMWYSLAARAGDEAANEKLKLSTFRNLSSGQLSEAQRRAAAWSAYVHRTERPDVAGQEAEAKGSLREAFDHYLKAIQALPTPPPIETNDRLRKHIINIVLQLTPPPAIPEEARQHAAYALAAIQLAEKEPRQLMSAIEELEYSLKIAPWWPEAYFNSAAVSEKAELYFEAARLLRFYLLAAPNAKDAPAVQQKIYQLEYKSKQQSGR